jgi:hyperosmotically inducible protein
MGARGKRTVEGRLEASPARIEKGFVLRSLTMDRIKTTALVTALAASALLVAGCEQRGQDTASRQGDAANSKLMGKADQPGLMGKSSEPDQAAQPAQSSPSQSLAQTGEKLAAAADDTAITAKVKASILAEPGLKSTQIDVETRNATVTLSGTVDSDIVRDRAKQIAMSTDGVKNVVDNMNLKTSS